MRRTMALFMALLFILPPRAKSATVIQTAQVVALVDEAGEDILSVTEAERIYTVRADALYAVGRDGDYQLCDDAGYVLSETRFSMIADMGEVLIYQKDGLFGAMSDDGSPLVEPVWTQLVPAAGGAFLALRGDLLDDVADKVLLLTSDGNVRATGVEVMNGLKPLQEDRMPYTASDGRCGYLHGLGRTVIPATWDYAGPFQDGTAIVSGAEGCMLIDLAGNALLPNSYAWMARGEGFVAAWAEDGTVDVYASSSGDFLYEIDNVQQVSVIGRYVAAQAGDEARLYDDSGVCVSEAAGDALFFPGWNDQVIVSEGVWGEAAQHLIDRDGATLEGRWQGILPLCADRYAFMTVSGVEYYSGDLNGLQTSWDYDSLRYGMMDDTGRELLPARYREIRVVGEDRLLLIDDEGTTLTDQDGFTIRRWKAEGAAAIGE